MKRKIKLRTIEPSKKKGEGTFWGFFLELEEIGCIIGIIILFIQFIIGLIKLGLNAFKPKEDERFVVFQNNKKHRLDTELLNIFFEKDSIYTENSSKQIAEMRTLYETEKKEANEITDQAKASIYSKDD